MVGAVELSERGTAGGLGPHDRRTLAAGLRGADRSIDQSDRDLELFKSCGEAFL
jgi:hypothetical protein